MIHPRTRVCCMVPLLGWLCAPHSASMLSLYDGRPHASTCCSIALEPLPPSRESLQDDSVSGETRTFVPGSSQICPTNEKSLLPRKSSTKTPTSVIHRVSPPHSTTSQLVAFDTPHSSETYYRQLLSRPPKHSASIYIAQTAPSILKMYPPHVRRPSIS
ncbi:hypothetical protein MVEN_00097600 [Mycena venus]|uniref:Secreted protein n=1 Tax=Mycena venus TaxID=2733690 RepID=A0A8H7DHG4_9AGAR|nr:hypothetical protein MVEN_00097600 [Mycena venus]